MLPSTTISALKPVLQADLDGSAVFPVDDKNGETRKASVSQVTASVNLANAIMSVRDFGAKGDGMTNDTSAIQAALDAVASHGGVVLVPSGVYKITSALQIHSGTCLRGAGNQLASTLAQYGDADGLRAGGNGGARNIVVEDLFILDALGADRTQGFGIHLDDGARATSFSLNRVGINGFVDGLHVYSSITSRAFQLRCNGAKRDGLACYGPCTSTTFDACMASGCGRHGHYVDGPTTYTTWVSCAADGSGGDAYHVDCAGGLQASFLSFMSCACEQTRGRGFYFSRGYGHTLVSPQVARTTGIAMDGFHFDGATRITVIGGEAFGCTGYGVRAVNAAAPGAITFLSTNFGQNALGALSDANAAIAHIERYGSTFTSFAPAGYLGAPLESAMQSINLPANALSAVGRVLRVTTWGSTASNDNIKTIRLLFGETVLGAIVGPLNGRSWRLEALVGRVTITNETFSSVGTSGSTLAFPAITNQGSASEDLTEAILIRTVAVSTSNGDIRQDGTLVEVLA